MPQWKHILVIICRAKSVGPNHYKYRPIPECLAATSMPSHFDTLQLHAGQHVEKEHRARAPPIYASTSFVFDDSKHGAQLFGLETEGHIYSRITNPTNDIFEQRVAALEGGIGAVATSSGHAAQFMAISGLAHAGDNIVSSTYLYGGTVNQLKVTFKRLGIETRFAASDDVAEYAKLIDDNTKAIYVESIGNPGFNVPDFEALAELAHKNGIPVVVDNTFGIGGFLINPIAHGADIVVHSATKWIGGHGTTIAGVVVDSGKFPWSKWPKKFPQLSEPSPSYHGLVFNDAFKELAYLFHLKVEILRDQGQTLNPFGAFQLIQGLETLSLRGERHSDNAAKLAAYLDKSPYVEWVSYLGLASHPHHEKAKKYFNSSQYFGGMLSFGVKDLDKPVEDPFKEASPSVVDHLKIASNLANVGDSKTLVIAPYYTTHQQLSESEKVAAGVFKGLIRVSVGTEFIDDIIADFDQAIKAVFESK